MSVIVGGLLARELAQRRELHMDYRAAGAAAYLGMGATWTMGPSSSAAQLQANAESMPQELLAISGVIPFTKTIFLCQSISIAAAITMVASAVAYFFAPESKRAVTAENLGVDVTSCGHHVSVRRRPGEWLEYSPILTLLLISLGCGWLLHELAAKNAIVVISSLNTYTYNLALLLLGLLLHWRPRHFLDAFSAAVSATPGILIQFPIYAGLGAILVNAKGGYGLSHHLAMIADHAASAESFPVLVGLYSTLTGIFLPSGGGRWIIEAPFIIQAANDLHVSLGWAVVSFNAAGTLPNLINPFWMVPLLGILRLNARDLMGFTLTQFLVLGPVVLILLWVLAKTLSSHPLV
jgi:short-chain fatty acids transporter